MLGSETGDAASAIELMQKTNEAMTALGLDAGCPADPVIDPALLRA